MAIYEFEGKRPIIGKSSYIHPQAVIIGDVSIGEDCFIAAGVLIRADDGKIIIGNGTNVQEGSIIHTQPFSTALIGNDVLIGHAAIVHGPCILADKSTIGMGAILLMGCEMESESLLAAGSLLAPGKVVSKKKLAIGNPAKEIKEMDEEMLAMNAAGVQVYKDMAKRSHEGMKLISE